MFKNMLNKNLKLKDVKDLLIKEKQEISSADSNILIK